MNLDCPPQVIFDDLPREMVDVILKSSTEPIQCLLSSFALSLTSKIYFKLYYRPLKRLSELFNHCEKLGYLSLMLFLRDLSLGSSSFILNRQKWVACSILGVSGGLGVRNIFFEEMEQYSYLFSLIATMKSLGLHATKKGLEMVLRELPGFNFASQSLFTKKEFFIPFSHYSCLENFLEIMDPTEALYSDLDVALTFNCFQKNPPSSGLEIFLENVAANRRLSENGSHERVLKLLHVNLGFHLSKTAILSLCSNGDLPSVELYLKKLKADQRILITQGDYTKCLQNATLSGSLPLVNMLVQDMKWNTQGMMQFAIRSNRLPVAKLLKDLGAASRNESIMEAALLLSEKKSWDFCFEVLCGSVSTQCVNVAIDSPLGNGAEKLRWIREKGVVIKPEEFRESLMNCCKLEVFQFYASEYGYKVPDAIIEYILEQYDFRKFVNVARWILSENRPDFKPLRNLNFVQVFVRSGLFLELRDVLKKHDPRWSREEVIQLLSECPSTDLKRVLDGILAMGFKDFDIEFLRLVSMCPPGYNRTMILRFGEKLLCEKRNADGFIILSPSFSFF